MWMIDTSTCVSILRRRLPIALERLRQSSGEDISISSISAAELYHGAAKSADALREVRKVQDFLAVVRPLEFGSNAAVSYGFVRYFLERKGTVIGAMDMLIAAHALAEGAILVTHNTREFRRIPGLEVEDWTA